MSFSWPWALLALLVIPLVFASLASGVVQLGELSHLGPLAGRTFTLFFLNMAIAATLGEKKRFIAAVAMLEGPETKTMSRCPRLRRYLTAW